MREYENSRLCDRRRASRDYGNMRIVKGIFGRTHHGGSDLAPEDPVRTARKTRTRPLATVNHCGRDGIISYEFHESTRC